ncbi:hypothetical protein M405DRAFT_802452, partial [Rhizopogon salebrosus TDB-379]
MTKFNKRVGQSRLAATPPARSNLTLYIQDGNAGFDVGDIPAYPSTIQALIYFHRHTPSHPLVRLTSTIVPPTEVTPSFEIDAKNKSYRHQYANIYFTRLIMLRDAVEKRAKARWGGLANEPLYVARVLDVVKSQLCWVIGTVYMDMPLKPNVLEDIGRDHSIPPPPPREKFYCDEDSVMLEDESGRIKLVGDRIAAERLVTGVIVAALGIETPSGDFEVVDLCTAGLASFAEEEVMGSDDMDVDMEYVSSPAQDEYVAVISGLSIGSASSADAQIQMLVEYLTGEAGGPEDQQLASQISRLIIAGNSLSLVEYSEDGEEERKPRKFGASAQAKFSPHPNLALSAHLLD